MAKINLSKVSTDQLWAELQKRKVKENFTYYYIDLGYAYDRINPEDEPRNFKTLNGEKKLRAKMMDDAEDALAQCFSDTEMSFWEDSEEYDDFFVDENN
jgi:hypothetical protein